MRLRLRWLLPILPAAVFLAAQTAPEGIIPDDPFFKYQITFRNPGGALKIPLFSYSPRELDIPKNAGIDLDIVRAWSITTGSKSVVVALIDDGFFYQHEDVKDNIWHNPGEIGLDARGLRKDLNGVDDDHNGYVDDVMGWDFAFNDPEPDAYIFDGMDNTRITPNWHSINALGIIGAKGNNGIGVAGINWDVSMMLLKIGAQGLKLNEPDLKRTGYAAKALRYAADDGARVINWSGYITDTRPEQVENLRAAFEYAAKKGVLIVVGAGNERKDIDDPANVTYPACFETENNVAVAELDPNGELVRYPVGDRILGSNYGPCHTHIAALSGYFTTDVQNGLSAYRIARGTSNAAPVVSGVAALILSVRPQLKARELKQILMDSATRLPSLEGKVACGGVVNAYRALKLALERYPVASARR